MIISRRTLLVLAALLLSAAQGAWAQTVTTEEELRTAVQTNDAKITLGADITLSEELVIDGKRTVTLDLNGQDLVETFELLKGDGTPTATFFNENSHFAGGAQGVAAHGQGFSLAGDSYKYNWTPATDYAAGHVYKIANKTFTATTARQAMPR